MSTSPEEALNSAVATLNGQNTDVLLYTGSVSDEGFDQVLRKAPSCKRDNVLLVLVTFGGEADAAYRIARFLRRAYEKVTVYAPSLCKSAGTLICIGAHELVMADSGELGPLDVQIRDQDELFTYRSGLAIPQALDFLEGRVCEMLGRVLIDAAGGGLSTAMASEIAVKTVADLYAPICSKIEPMRLGEITRTLTIAYDYARRFGGNLRDGALERLLSDYPSHSFVIDKEEVRDLFESVREPREAETAIASYCQLDSIAGGKDAAQSETKVCYITDEPEEGADHEASQD